MDRRTDRVQSIKLSPDFFPLDIHKSMFINDLMISLPSYYVKSWGNEILNQHTTDNQKWEVDIEYQSPKEMGKTIYKFKGKLTLANSKGIIHLQFNLQKIIQKVLLDL
jgi:hypothetical protein